MKKIIFIALLGLCCNPLIAQRKKDKQPIAKADSVKKGDLLSTIITKNTEIKKGLFNVYRNGDKFYFEIPDSILKKDLLLTSWLVKVPAGSPKFGGEKMNQMMFSFEKGAANKMYIRYVDVLTKSDSTNTISKAVANSSIDPISVVFDIKARGKGNASSILDVTDFLQKENFFTVLSTEVNRMLSLGAMAADKSYVKSVTAYPINVEIKMVRTYAANIPAKLERGQTILEAAKVAGTATLEISTSIMLMPEKPMMGRQFDLRVGYFNDDAGYIPMSDDQQNISSKNFIVRYRLEPKAEDMEKYKKGELVEPKEPIVYYIDPATPKQWRKYLILGINDWNEAFKSAGFKNAIIGKEWPENDTTMSLEDRRYKVLRYLPSSTPNAYGPNIHDPRSGEILQCYIGWYHNVMTLVHDWYMIQAGPNDPRARTMNFSEELMGELIRFVSSHEVGHTLGLRHNMGSSSFTPVEKLRDKEWVEKHGHCNSIMDYARFNYVAQPEDNIGPNGLMPRINDYDKWAIKWGYTYLGAASDEEDKKIVSKWVTDSLAANPALWYDGGSEGRNFDARCQTESVGDNNMKASTYGVKNLKYVMKHLPEWTKEEGDLYKNLGQMYLQVATQFNRYASHVANNIASVYTTFKMPDQSGDVFESAPVENQKEAVAWLNEYVFQTPNWLLEPNILNKIGAPIHNGAVKNVQNRIMMYITTDRVFNTLYIMQERFGTAKTYSINSYLTDLKQGVFSELKTNKPIEPFRRGVQTSYVNAIIRAMKEAEIGNNVMAYLFSPGAAEISPLTTNSDIGALLAMHLDGLRKEFTVSATTITDKDSKEHLLYLADYIKKAMSRRFEKNPTK